MNLYQLELHSVQIFSPSPLTNYFRYTVFFLKLFILVYFYLNSDPSVGEMIFFRRCIFWRTETAHEKGASQRAVGGFDPTSDACKPGLQIALHLRRPIAVAINTRPRSDISDGRARALLSKLGRTEKAK